jgi:hypothetical protein
MLRFIVGHGLVRFAGRRAVPALLAWDLLVLANRTRRIPIVDRNLRRGAGAAGGRLAAAAALRPRRIHLGRLGRPRRPGA